MDKSESTSKPDKDGTHPRARAKTNSPKALKRSKSKFLVVGIGASAGGVYALEQFFAHLPVKTPKPNIAFVVVTHLSPEHESNLAAIIQKHTSLPVVQVSETVPVKPNMVYVIPPARQLSMNDS